MLPPNLTRREAKSYLEIRDFRPQELPEEYCNDIMAAVDIAFGNYSQQQLMNCLFHGIDLYRPQMVAANPQNPYQFLAALSSIIISDQNKLIVKIENEISKMKKAALTAKIKADNQENRIQHLIQDIKAGKTE